MQIDLNKHQVSYLLSYFAPITQGVTLWLYGLFINVINNVRLEEA